MNDLPVLDLGDVQVRTHVKNIHFDELPDKSADNSVAGYARFIALSKETNPYEALETLLKEGYLVEFLEEKCKRVS